jgi:hypothetical protein
MSVITIVIAGYAAIVSTLSLALALKVYQAGNPKIEVDWEYRETNRQLAIRVLNVSRADVTITSTELYIVHEVTTHRSHSGKYFQVHMDTIDEVPSELWQVGAQAPTFPARLPSNSAISFKVISDGIALPSEYPFDELLLKFVARFPSGRDIAYLRGDVLRHFMGIDPDRPITFPSPGSVPLEE